MKRLLSMFITLSMMVMMFAALPINAEGVTENSVQVGAAKLTAENKYLNYSSSDQTTSASRISGDTTVAEYDATTGTLTFTKTIGDGRYDGAEVELGSKAINNAVIYADGDLKIVINRDVKVWIYQGCADKFLNSAGIYSGGNLDISGDGELLVGITKAWGTNKTSGIKAVRNITSNIAKVSVYAWQMADSYNMTLVNADGGINIYDGCVFEAFTKTESGDSYKPKADKVGVFNKAPTIGANLDARVSYNDADCTWNGGKSPEWDGLTDYSADKFESVKYIRTKIKEADTKNSVQVGNAVLDASTPYLIIGEKGVCSASEKSDGSSAVFNPDTKILTFTANTGMIPGVLDNTDEKKNRSFVIRAADDLTIVVNKKVTAWLYILNEGYQRTVWTDGNLTLKGEGTLMVATSKGWAGTSSALYSEKSITIDGLKTELYEWQQTSTSNSIMFNSKEDINIINNASVTATVGTIESSDGKAGVNKIFSKAPSIYEGAIVKTSESSPSGCTWNTAGTAPSDLTGYEESKIDTIKWFQAGSPEPEIPTGNETEKVIIGGVELNAQTPYLGGKEDAFAASGSENGSYAKLDAETGSLIFLKSVEIKGRNTDGGSSKGTGLFCIYVAEGDLKIEIPRGIEVVLDPGQDCGPGAKSIAVQKGSLSIIGKGNLVAKGADRWWNDSGSYSAAIYASDRIIIGGVNAQIYTWFDQRKGVDYYALYSGKSDIDIIDYATVTLAVGDTKTEGTAINRVVNAIPEIYETAIAKMADTAVTSQKGIETPENIVDYDKSNINKIKYLTIEPQPILLKGVSGLNKEGLLPATNPKLTLEFSTEVEEADVSKLTLGDGASVTSAEIQSDKHFVDITIDGFKLSGSYTLTLSGIKNAGERTCGDSVKFTVSGGVDVDSVKLNGSESGSVKGGANAVSVTISKNSGIEQGVSAAVFAVVSEDTADGRAVKSVKMAEQQNIDETVTVDITDLNAASGDTISVYIWDGKWSMKRLAGCVEFN